MARVRKIDVWNNKKKVISKIPLCLNCRDNIGILGPNGADKTYFVKLIERGIYLVASNGSKYDTLTKVIYVYGEFGQEWSLSLQVCKV